MAAAFMSSTKYGKIDQAFALVDAERVTVMNGVREVMSGQKEDGKDYDFVKDRGKKECAARQIGGRKSCERKLHGRRGKIFLCGLNYRHE